MVCDFPVDLGRTIACIIEPSETRDKKGTEACARKGEIPKFAKYAQILKNSVASEGDCQREGISDEGPGGSGRRR